MLFRSRRRTRRLGSCPGWLGCTQGDWTFPFPGWLVSCCSQPRFLTSGIVCLPISCLQLDEYDNEKVASKFLPTSFPFPAFSSSCSGLVVFGSKLASSFSTTLLSVPLLEYSMLDLSIDSLSCASFLALIIVEVWKLRKLRTGNSI